MHRLLLPLITAMVAWVVLATPAPASPGGGLTGGSPSQSPPRTTVRVVTITSDPNPSLVAAAVTISGHVRGQRVGGLQVLLWRKRPRDRLFHLSTIGQTDSRGNYLFILAPDAVRTNTRWYVSALGVPSPMLLQRVRAQLTLSVSGTSVAPGERVIFSGHVTPEHVGDPVQLEQLGLDGWQVIAHQVLDQTSSFTIAHRFPPAHTKVRVVLPDDVRNATSFSPSLAMDVRDIHRIKHVVIIMQENRSFDSYFGTFPGANGIPPGVCVPDPMSSSCVAPYHDPSDRNDGGPHGWGNSAADINGGQMDGFIDQAQKASGCGTTPNNPNCSPCDTTQGSLVPSNKCIDVMGYHDAREIPNYWTYAQNYVLQDHMFEPDASWSLPQHLYLVSGWSAACTDPLEPFSCTGAPQNPNFDGGYNGPNDRQPHYAWTDLTFLLHKHQVSWAYYVFQGGEPDCADPSVMSCPPVSQSAQTPGIWNPLPSFTDVSQDGELGNIQSLNNFYAAAANGTLPAVSWIAPNSKVSEHPPGLVSDGQGYVTGLINAIMRGPAWRSTAIFVSWDDWGGFYDHVVPPRIDFQGYGLRVPGIVISAYARQGFIDHQVLSHDAYNKFIEDDFLGGQRIDPNTDGRPDPRPRVREASAMLGDLANDFDFSQRPRRPLFLSANPPPGPASTPP